MNVLNEFLRNFGDSPSINAVSKNVIKLALLWVKHVNNVVQFEIYMLAQMCKICCTVTCKYFDAYTVRLTENQ